MATGSATTIEFGELIRRLVLLEKRRPAAAVAATLGLTQSSFYRRMQGHARFDPDQIALLLGELDDDRLRRWLFAGTRILLVRRPSEQPPAAGKTPFDQTAAAAEATIKALLYALAVFDPGQPQSDAAQRTESLIDEAAAALLSVKLDVIAGRWIAQQPNGNLTNGGFGPLAARILLEERDVRLGDLAVSLGLGYHPMRERLVGRTPFTPEELRRLFRLYPESRLADYVLRQSPYIALPLPAADGGDDGHGPIQAGLLSLRQLLVLLRVFRTPADDPDAASPHVVAREIDAALRHLVSLHWSTTYIGRQADRRQRYRADYRIGDSSGEQVADARVQAVLSPER